LRFNPFEMEPAMRAPRLVLVLARMIVGRVVPAAMVPMRPMRPAHASIACAEDGLAGGGVTEDRENFSGPVKG